MLVLPIQKRWFDMIVSGEKKEEYREVKPYYHARLKKYMLHFPLPTDVEYGKVHCPIHPTFQVIFRNGYKHDSPQVKCLCQLRIGTGKQKWGAVHNKEYYVLKILEVLEVRK